MHEGGSVRRSKVCLETQLPLNTYSAVLGHTCDNTGTHEKICVMYFVWAPVSPCYQASKKPPLIANFHTNLSPPYILQHWRYAYDIWLQITFTAL